MRIIVGYLHASANLLPGEVAAEDAHVIDVWEAEPA